MDSNARAHAPISFGHDAIDLEGSRAVIGATHDNGANTNTGAAYIYEKVSNVWTQQQKLIAPDGASADYFGIGASLSGDTVVIGAYDDDNNGSQSGSAYVFVFDGIGWNLQQHLFPSDGTGGDVQRARSRWVAVCQRPVRRRHLHRTAEQQQRCGWCR